ncbi:MAG: hypothetical protein H6698_07065 [Myxococcales bacterium]|nr:hypothetical protein [Myxococcales bacterium]
MNRQILRAVAGCAGALAAAVALLGSGCSDALTSLDSAWWPDDGGSGTDDRGPQEPAVPVTPALLLSAPAASRSFVFVANELRGTVAKIQLDLAAVRIEPIRVGAGPTLIVTSPESDVAVVLNEAGGNVTVIDASVPGDVTTRTVDTLDGVDHLSLSPDGGYAIAWRGYAPGSSAAQLLAEVSLVDVDGDAAVAPVVSVGTGVADVAYDATSENAYVVSLDGVSRVPLAAATSDTFAPPLAVWPSSERPRVGEPARVVVMAEARIAAAWSTTSDRLFLRDLDGGDVVEVELGEGNGVGADGQLAVLDASGTLVAAAPEASAITWVDAGAALRGEDGAVSAVDIGASVTQLVVSRDGALVAAFAHGDALLHLIDSDTREVRHVDLRKGIDHIVFADDGADLAVSHTKGEGEPEAGSPADELLDRIYAATIVDLESDRTKLVQLASYATEVAFSPTAALLLVPGASELVRVDREALSADTTRFARPVEHVGVVPGVGAAYVSQVHPMGRIAFVDLQTGETREITGFELNALID